jgi:hypothetical protein
MNFSTTFPPPLRDFVNTSKWIYAKTMPDWPHEYIVRKNVDENLFMQLVQYIRTNGYEGKFFSKNITYYDYRGLVYWTMGAPLKETIVVNRCRKEDSYEFRLMNNRVPKIKIGR